MNCSLYLEHKIQLSRMIGLWHTSRQLSRFILDIILSQPLDEEYDKDNTQAYLTDVVWYNYNINYISC